MPMPDKMITLAVTGLREGNMILRKMEYREQPSINAASSRSTGMLPIKLEYMKMDNGSP